MRMGEANPQHLANALKHGSKVQSMSAPNRVCVKLQVRNCEISIRRNHELDDALGARSFGQRDHQDAGL